MVSVRVTVPAVLSAALGEYVVTGLAASPKVPVPDVVHPAKVAPPPNEPFRFINGVVAHIP